MAFTFERIKYPIFVLGAILMTLPAIIYKYHPFQVSIVTYSVVIGFILFAISIVSGIASTND
jgi:hypothetical protein